MLLELLDYDQDIVSIRFSVDGETSIISFEDEKRAKILRIYADVLKDIVRLYEDEETSE